MKLSRCAMACGLSCAMAMPSQEGDAGVTAALDGVKLNQYRSYSDCQNDRNILYHAAPVVGKCYTIDGQTGAFFINTGGFRASHLYKGQGCSGDSIGVSGGFCLNRDQWNSFKLA